jgi:hypothetical protein
MCDDQAQRALRDSLADGSIPIWMTNDSMWDLGFDSELGFGRLRQCRSGGARVGEVHWLSSMTGAIANYLPRDVRLIFICWGAGCGGMGRHVMIRWVAWNEYNEWELNQMR